MKLSEYLKKSGMTSKEYFEMQKRKQQGKTTLGDYQRQQRASIASRLEVLNMERSSVYDTYKSRFFNEDGEYLNSYRNDTEDAYNSFSNFKAKYDTEAKEILEHLDRYGGDYDAEWVNGVKKWLNGDIESFGEMEKAYKTDYDYWSQWDTEDDYKASLRKTEEREKMRAANLEDIAVEIAELEKQYKEERHKISGPLPSGAADTAMRNASPEYAAIRTAIDEIGETLEAKKAYLESAKAVQDYEKYSTDELYKLANEATYNDESLYFRGLASQKIVQDKSEILANNKMDGEDVSVLEALRDLGRIEDKDERNARQKVISDKMVSLGVDFDEYYTRITGDDNITLGGVADWLGSTAMTGLASWNKGISSTADLIFGKPLQALGWENNPISSIAQHYDESYDNRVFNRNLAASKISDSKWIDYAGQFGEGLIAAVPDALLAMMTAGASKISVLGKVDDLAKAPSYIGKLNKAGDLSKVAAYAGGDKLTKAGLTVQSMMKNPNYWSSFARTYGLDYAEAKEMGASDTAAVFGATISSLINAGVEIGIDGGSGIQGFAQDLAEGNKNKFFAWVESSLEEGGEEILQGFVNNLVSKTMYDDSVELANFEQMIAEGAMGTAVGAVLGGGQMIASSAANKAKQAAAVNEAYKKHGQAVVKDGGVDTLQALANEMSGVVDTDIAANLSKLAGKVNGKKGVNAKAVGKLSYALNDARIQQNKADIVKALEEKGVSEKKGAKYADILFEMNEEFFAGKESAFTLGTDEQWKKITGDENAYSVLRNIITDEKSPVNIRNLRYGLSRNGIRVDSEGNVNQEDVANYHTRQLVRAASEGLITPVKNEFDVSENGKTQITESGETVKKRAFVDGADGTLRLQVNDNSIVDVGDVSFADEGEAIVYSTIVAMGMDAESANAVLSLYKGKDKKAGSRFAKGINIAFNAGKINHSPNILQTIHSLTAQQADAVYKLGRQYALKSARKAQERVDAKKKKTTSTNRGEVIYEGDLADENGNLAVKESELNGMQQASLSGIRLLAEISNIRFHIYRSEQMISKDGGKEFRYIAPNGESVTANGFYITGTNDIYIDLNAGNDGEGTMMYTAAHEIMHFIKEFSPAKFQQIADFLMEEYAKRNVNVQMLLQKQIEIVKNRSDAGSMTYEQIHDMAFEEMVCDAMSGMLIDGSFADSMAKLHQTNRGLWQTIADAVAKLLEKWGVVVNAYNNKQMDSQEARLVAQMDGAFRKLQQMFAEGMVDAGAAYAQMEKTGSEKYSRRNGFNSDDIIKYSDRSNGKNLVKSKKSRYNEFATLAMQWANSNSTQTGDAKTIYDGERKKYVLIEATDDGFVEVTAYTRKEYERYYGRVNRSGVGFSESSVEVQNDKGGHRAYDVRVEDAGVNGKNDTFLETERIPVRSENDKQGNRADYQGELTKTSQRTNGKVLYQERSTALLEREETRIDYAPVFYSKLERLVDDMKEQKLGADSVIGYLKGRGIKDEEIKQLGIQELLKGKKSVTKLELKKTIAENMPRIEEIVLEGGPDATEYVDYDFLPGGSNYRDVLFRVPDSTYSNKTMRGHWQEHAKGILAHTRIQDFIDVYGKRLLFIEEVQSDWYNQKNRMGSEEIPSDKVKEYKTKKENLEKQRQEDPEKIDQEIMYLQNEYHNILDEENQLEAFPPDNLFGEAYYEYILKRLIRMAAEQGYDSIAWTPASVQMLRWTEDFKEAFHILYDQNMVGFLKRHGKQWGAKVGTTLINTNVEICDVDKLEEYEDTVGDENYNVRVEDIPLTPFEVWNMELTEPMKNAVLYEGQMMFQERSTESAAETSENKYSYEELIRKPDMLITTVGGNVPTNRADVVALAKKNAAKVGKTNKDGSVSVHVNDIDTDVILTTHGLRHGLRRKQQMTKANGIVTLMAGEIIQNSIRINELIPAASDVDRTYILMGIAKDINGYVYIVRSVVNRYDNELMSMDALYAVNAKKELAVQSAPRLAGNPLSVTSSTISIADLLDYVNEYFPDILPEDVLRHYGYTERPGGDLGGAVLYQQRTSDPTQEKVVQQLEKENAQLVADLAAVKELLALQGKVTDGKMFSKTSLQAVAKRLAGKVNAKGDVAELAELLNDSYGYILTEREASWDGFAEKARPVTAWLMRHAQEKKTRTDEAQAALKYIRSKSVYLDEAQKQEVDYIFGSYNDFRKKAMGRITVTDSARVSLDSQWQEFAEMFPAYFDRDVNSGDQPLALMEAIDALQNTYDYFGSDMMNEQSLLMDVYDGYWDIATLRTVADKAQKEINLLKAKHRRQMADIRDKHKQADAQLRREYVARAKKMRENYRKQSEARIEKIAVQYQASRKRGVENRRKTEMRHKIRRVAGELNKLLLHGSKDHNVKIGLQKATAEALSAVNMDTVNAEKRLAEIQRKIDATSDPKKIAELQQTYDRVELQGENMARKLTALKNAYEEIKDSSDPLVANAYHPAIEERIKNLRKEVGDTPLREMSLEQLENVYDTYRMVLHTIRAANKAFKADKAESITSLADQVMEEVHRVGGTKAYSIKGTAGIKKFYWNALKPVYAFKTIGSDTLSALFDNVRAGEDLWATDVSEAKDYFKGVSEKYGYDSWDLDRQYSFKSKTGREFSLSIEQIMSLYAYSKRKQADEHIEKGGFVFDGEIEVTQKKFGVPVKYTVNTAAAHNLSRETLGEIIGVLSEKQRAFVDEMQAYLSDVMGAKGNEVSLEMFGVELFKEKAYFPLKSAKQFIYEQNEVAGEIRLKNSGFSKETVAHANNPIILSNFMDVWANHVNDMSMYHAFVLPLEDFNRVFNYKTPSTEDLDTESVKMYIQNAYGEQPIRYIKQLLTDLNGGARSDPSADIITRMTSLFKKAAVFGSASVVIQQPSAIARAASMVDSKYFATKLSVTQHQKEWAEVKKYAPVAIIKEMGYFDTHMGKSTTDFIKAKNYETFGEKAKGLFTDSGYRDEVLSKAPALADELSWCYIWNAVKKEIADTTELAKGSEPFLKKCGERFTEVVVHTQVYDSVLSRSAMMRSKDTGMKMATVFMAEPTTSINMLADAIIQGKRGDKSAAAKTVGAVVASLILNAVLVSFVYAGRDDDEDETYAEKYAGALAGELVDSFNPLTMIPFVKDIVSIAQGYDVERSDMAIISDLFTAFEKLNSDKLPTYRKIEDFGGAVAAIFGLPLKNVMRDIRAVYNTVSTFLNGEEISAEGVVEAVKEEVVG